MFFSEFFISFYFGRIFLCGLSCLVDSGFSRMGWDGSGRVYGSFCRDLGDGVGR